MADSGSGPPGVGKKHSVGFQAEYEAAMASGVRNPNVPKFIYDMYEKEQAEKQKKLEEKRRIEQERLRSLQKINRPQPKAQKKKPVFGAKAAIPSSSTAASQSSPATQKSGASTYDHWVNKDADWGYSRPAKKQKKKEDKYVTFMVGRKPYKLPADFSKQYTMTQALRSRAFRILRSEGEIRKSNGFYTKVFGKKLRERKIKEEEARRPTHAFAPPANLNFAPPSNLNFAPPASYDSDPPSTSSMTSPLKGAESGDAHSHRRSYSPPARVYDDPTGEDAYQRRMRMSQQASQPAYPPPPQAQPSFPPPQPPQHAPPPLPGAQPPFMHQLPPHMVPPPPPMGMHSDYAPNAHAFPPPPPPGAFALPPIGPYNGPPGLFEPPPPPPSFNPPPSTSPTITGAPVRYDLNALPTNEQDLELALEEFNDEVLAEIEAEIEKEAAQSAPRSNAPGQMGFAQRYMESKGWKQGEGLGAKKNGIKNAIRLVKAKRSAKGKGGSMAGGSGFGRIVGSK